MGLGFKGSSFEVEGGWTEGLGSELEDTWGLTEQVLIMISGPFGPFSSVHGGCIHLSDKVCL